MWCKSAAIYYKNLKATMSYGVDWMRIGEMVESLRGLSICLCAGLTHCVGIPVSRDPSRFYACRKQQRGCACRCTAPLLFDGRGRLGYVACRCKTCFYSASSASVAEAGLSIELNSSNVIVCSSIVTSSLSFTITFCSLMDSRMRV